MVKHFLACLCASMRGMWDYLAPANPGAPVGCSHSSLACVGSCCLARRQQGAHQLFRLVQVGYMLVPGTVVCCCRSPGEGKVTRWSPTSLGMWSSSCLVWWVPLWAGSKQESCLPCCLLRAYPPCQSHGGFPGKVTQISASWESLWGRGKCKQEAACQALP